MTEAAPVRRVRVLGDLFYGEVLLDVIRQAAGTGLTIYQ